MVGVLPLAAKTLGFEGEDAIERVLKKMEKGEIRSETFLAAFGKQLKAFTAPAAIKAADGNRAAMNRLNNSWQKFQNTIHQAGFGDAMKEIYAFLVDLMDVMNPVAKFLTRTLSKAFMIVTFPIRMLIAALGDLSDYIGGIVSKDFKELSDKILKFDAEIVGTILGIILLGKTFKVVGAVFGKAAGMFLGPLGRISKSVKGLKTDIHGIGGDITTMEKGSKDGVGKTGKAGVAGTVGTRIASAIGKGLVSLSWIGLGVTIANSIYDGLLTIPLFKEIDDGIRESQKKERSSVSRIEANWMGEPKDSTEKKAITMTEYLNRNLETLSKTIKDALPSSTSPMQQFGVKVEINGDIKEFVDVTVEQKTFEQMEADKDSLLGNAVGN